MHVHEHFDNVYRDLDFLRDPRPSGVGIHEVVAQITVLHVLEERLDVGLLGPSRADKLGNARMLEHSNQFDLFDELLGPLTGGLAIAETLGCHALIATARNDPDVVERAVADLLDIIDVVRVDLDCE